MLDENLRQSESVCLDLLKWIAQQVNKSIQEW